MLSMGRTRHSQDPVLAENPPRRVILARTSWKWLAGLYMNFGSAYRTTVATWFSADLTNFAHNPDYSK